MKITKYFHSCLLVEEQEQTILIDPGNFTYDEKVLDISSLSNLTAVFITHEHLDHCYIPFLQDISHVFPNTPIISNASVISALQKENIIAVDAIPKFASAEIVPHGKLWFGEPPLNSVFTLFHKITHPGDSFRFKKTAPVLALPLQAPWGSVTQAVEKALNVHPTTIIPIHDYHWKDTIRKNMYIRLEEFFAEKQIVFIPLETGQTIEV